MNSGKSTGSNSPPSSLSMTYFMAIEHSRSRCGKRLGSKIEGPLRITEAGIHMAQFITERILLCLRRSRATHPQKPSKPMGNWISLSPKDPQPTTGRCLSATRRQPSSGHAEAVLHRTDGAASQSRDREAHRGWDHHHEV